MKSCSHKRRTDLFDLGKVAGFHTDLQIAAGDGHIGIRSLVVNADHVTAALGDDAADALELAGLILQGNLQRGVDGNEQNIVL